MRINLLFILIFGFVCAGCGGQGGGDAPSPQLVPPSTESYFKYGETVADASGWEASLDTTDPVEEVTLANGWSLEVRND